MSTHEQPRWQQLAASQLECAVSPAIAGNVEADLDRSTSRDAVVQEYNSWHDAEIAPQQDVAWRLALDALARFGAERRIRTENGYSAPEVHHEILTTGLLLCGPDIQSANGTAGTAIELTANVSSLDTKTVATIEKSRKKPYDTQRLQAATEQLDRTIDSVIVNTRSISTTGQTFDDLNRGIYAEVQYPRTLRERRDNYSYLSDINTRKRVNKAMEKPDAIVYTAPLRPFTVNGKDTSEVRLMRPHRIEYSPGRYQELTSKDLEAAQAKARAATAHYREIGSMLTQSIQPVRKTISFEPLQ